MADEMIVESTESKLVDNEELRELVESCSTCGW